MIKQFVKDSTIYGLATIIARGISFILLPFYTRVLTPEDYGVIDILTVFTALVCLTVPLEIAQALAIYYSEAQSKVEKQRCASTTLWFTICVYAIFAVAGFFLAAPLTELILDSPQRLGIFRVALLATGLQGLFYLLQGQLRWMLLPRGYAVTSLVTTLMTIAMTILFVLVLRMGIMGVILGQIGGNLVGAGLAFSFGRHSYSLSFDWVKLGEMLRFSIPLVPASISVFVMLYIDRLMIKNLLSMADVGIFGVAYRITSVVSLLMIAFRGALTPLIYNNYRKAETPAEIAQIFRYFCAFGLLIFVGLSLFSKEIVLVFAPAEFQAAAGTIPFLVPATILADMYIFAPGLTITKKTHIVAAINIFGALLTTLLNFSLIPLLGVRGAALANLFSNAVIFALNIYFSQKYYSIPYSWGRLGSGLILSALLVLLGALLDFEFITEIAIKTGFLCLAAGGFVLLRLVNVQEIGRVGKMIAHGRS